MSTVSGFRRHMCTWTDNTLTHIHTLYSADQGYFWWEANQKVVLWCWMSSSPTLRETTGCHTTKARKNCQRTHEIKFCGFCRFYSIWVPFEVTYASVLVKCSDASKVSVLLLHEIETKILMTEPGLVGKIFFFKEVSYAQPRQHLFDQKNSFKIAVFYLNIV